MSFDKKKILIRDYKGNHPWLAKRVGKETFMTPLKFIGVNKFLLGSGKWFSIEYLFYYDFIQINLWFNSAYESKLVLQRKTSNEAALRKPQSFEVTRWRDTSKFYNSIFLSHLTIVMYHVMHRSTNVITF